MHAWISEYTLLQLAGRQYFMCADARVLKSELAGVWYVGDPKRLAREIDVYLDAVDMRIEGRIAALLLPHAGYRYSGMVAAHAVKQIVGQTYSRVIVIGPSHRMPMMDAVSIPDVNAVETPLGRIEMDRALAERLWDDRLFQSHTHAHFHEHSVQIELPFLQRALGDFKLLPIVCGELGERSAREIGAALLENMDADTLIVVSSDFTHYGNGFNYVPFRDDIKANLEALDMGAFRLIEQKDLSGFLQYVQETRATICGRSPIAVVLSMLSEQSEVRLLKYDTSGNLTGDWLHCVSYVSAAVTGQWSGKSSDQLQCENERELASSDKLGLLRLARHCIAERLRENEPERSLASTAAMQEVMGAFVTLRKHGQLRGCIGEIVPRRALVEAVREQAVNAAFHDPRFPRLREDELPEIEIEISALTAPHRVGSYEDIHIGKDGIVLYKGSHSAVFLPQVATEQQWDLEETLSHLALKAGLAPDAWHEGCEFQVFQAIVFREHRD